MRNRDYKRVGEMLDLINREDRIIEPIELIARFIPSMYELNLVYNMNLKGAYYGIRIDSQSKVLKGAIRKATQLKNEEDFSSDEILRYLRS